jgi:hypothetical protein
VNTNNGTYNANLKKTALSVTKVLKSLRLTVLTLFGLEAVKALRTETNYEKLGIGRFIKGPGAIKKILPF